MDRATLCVKFVDNRVRFRYGKAGVCEGCVSEGGEMRKSICGSIVVAVLCGRTPFAGAQAAGDAEACGFSPDAEAAQNVAALQKALDGGKKTVTVSRPGEYRLNARVYVDSDTKLVFGPGVVLSKTGRYDFVLVNRGALTRTWNENISIDGLTIRVNGVDVCPSPNQPLYGLRGHLTMYFVKNLTVTHFRCTDVAKTQFCLHFCQFDNLVLDTFEIRGGKDGVHVGAGRNFAIRNGVCATGDDAVALNAQDYPSSQPMQGDIADGVVENVTDERKEKTAGNAVRMLSGAWPDWRPGIMLRNGDTVRHGKNVYRVVQKETGKDFASAEAPVHTEGAWTDKAGLTFYFSQSDGAVQANVRNVTFRNMQFKEDRNCFKASWDFCSANRAIHPDTPKERIPVIKVSVQNVCSFVPRPLIVGNASFYARFEDVVCLGQLASLKGRNVDCTLAVKGWRLAKDSAAADAPDIQFDGSGVLNLSLDDVSQERDIRLGFGKGTRVRVNGSASVDTLDGLAPEKGDSVRVGNVRKTYNGRAWE